MAQFYLTLDTTEPSNPVIKIEGGASFVSQLLVNLTIGTDDTSTLGYQMKIWGDVDITHDANIKTTEALSGWITYNTSRQIKLSSGDGAKNIYLKLRDDVYNESSVVSATINLDTAIPVITVNGGDVPKVSLMTGKNECTFTFSVNKPFSEFKVKVVSSTGATQDAGVELATANGSTNMKGTGGNYPATTPISCKITGADLKVASSTDGQKIIKVFAKDLAGKWSV